MRSLFVTALLWACFSTSASAAIMVTIVESGADVVASWSGTWDVTVLLPGTPTTLPFNTSRLGSGAIFFLNGANTYTEFTGAVFAGSGFSPGSVVANSSSGGTLILDNTGTIGLSSITGTSAGTATYNATTLTALGLVAGSVSTWTWGVGPNQIITLNVGSPPAAVPEPASFAVFSIGSLVFGAVSYRRRKRQASTIDSTMSP